MEWIGQFVLVLVIKLVSPASITPTPTAAVVTTTHKNEELKTSRTYQVTENVIDIPDNRTLPPIAPSFTIFRPLNYGNNTVLTNNKVEENNNSEDSSEENNNSQNNNEGKLKKNSFSILHIKAEYDDRPVQDQNHKSVFKKVFGGFKDYVYSLKRGVVDGLHSFFHKHDNDKHHNDKHDKESEFHDKFHRNFDDEHNHNDEYHHFRHY